jgi:coenzyme Q-binding protein COQ10
MTDDPCDAVLDRKGANAYPALAALAFLRPRYGFHVMAGKALRRRFSRVYPHFRPPDLFGLVADIESYPAFVPGCLQTRVLSRRDNVLLVENVFGAGPLRQKFTSQATLDSPDKLCITSDSGIWRRFRMDWRFEPSGSGCRLSCDMELEFLSGLLNAVAPFAAPDVESRILRAFELRAEKILGPGESKGNR